MPGLKWRLLASWGLDFGTNVQKNLIWHLKLRLHGILIKKWKP